MARLMLLLKRLFDSWYFWGVIGWLLIIRAAPIDAVLPRYAG